MKKYSSINGQDLILSCLLLEKFQSCHRKFKFDTFYGITSLSYGWPFINDKIYNGNFITGSYWNRKSMTISLSLYYVGMNYVYQKRENSEMICNHTA